MTTPTTKPRIQWEWIEAQWQRGTLSNYDIAKLHEKEFGRKIDESAIRKRVSSYGWQRDLDETIRRQARTKLVAREVRISPQEFPQGESAEKLAKTEDEQLVELASDALVTLELKHRKQIVGVGTLADTMGKYVALMLPVDVDGEPTLTYEPGEIKDLMSAANAAISARAKVIALERKSFGMDAKTEDAPTSDGRVNIFTNSAIVKVARRPDSEIAELNDRGTDTGTATA